MLVRQTPYSEDDPSRLSPEAQVLADAAAALLDGATLRGICRDLTRAVSRLRDGRGVRRWNTILRAS